MATQDIEKLIADLQKGQQELARRDREHDEHITILLGQVVTLLPEVRDMHRDITRIVERLDRHAELLEAIETSLMLLAGNITNMRTELLVIKALVAKEEE